MLGERLLLTNNPAPHIVAWKVRDPRTKSTGETVKVAFDEKVVACAEDNPSMRLLPGAADRALLLFRAVTLDQERGSLLQPVVIDASSGQIVWTRAPYHPDQQVNPRISVLPWDEKGIVIPGEEKGWAILRLKQPPGSSAPATALPGDVGTTSKPVPKEGTK